MKNEKKKDFSWIRDSRRGLPPGKWFVEFFTPGELHAHKTSAVLESSDTRFQQATLIKTHTFGKVLVIDSETQSSEYDEFIYHETLVVPALLLHPKPETALILGGGEGATARDILNSRSIKSVVMADIDYYILEFAKKHLASWHAGAFDDPRLELLVQDAKKYVLGTERKFDLVYSDLPSPIEGGPAFGLYTVEFYRKLKAIMNPGGIFAMQAGPGTPLQFELHPFIHNTLKKVFKTVRSYSTFIPAYDMPWTFLFCTDGKADPLKAGAAEIDRAAARLKKPLRYLDGASFPGLFSMPKYYRARMAREKGFISEARPKFFTTSQK